MQRRKVDTTTPAPAAAPADDPRVVPVAPLRRSNKGTKARGGSDSLSLLVVVIIILVGAISILSPSTVEKAEQKAADTTKEIIQEAYVAEKNMENYFHGQQQLPPQEAEDDTGGRQESLDATAAMKRQPSSWVDGEKKLKLKLKELIALQKDGKELGVPILTRWLGDDFPAWVSEGEDKDAWETKRKEKYADMAKDEEQWRVHVREQGEMGEDEQTEENFTP